MDRRGPVAMMVRRLDIIRRRRRRRRRHHRLRPAITDRTRATKVRRLTITAGKFAASQAPR